MWWLVAAMHFMLLHGASGQMYWINIDQVSTLRAPIPSDLQASFPRGTQCVVFMTNGKFVSVVETCEVVYQLVMGAR